MKAKGILLNVFACALLVCSAHAVFAANCDQFAFRSSDAKLRPVYDLAKATTPALVAEFAACVAALTPLGRDQNEPVKEGGVVDNYKAYVASGLKWTNDSQGAERQGDESSVLELDVCWVDDKLDSRAQNIVRWAVESTWAKHGNLRFSGWGRCAAENLSSISIAVRDVVPMSEVGTDSASKTPSMILNFTFGHDSMAGCKETPDQCIWAEAVHEFGHALFFEHEHGRADFSQNDQGCLIKLLSKDELRKVNPQHKPDTLATKYDKYSIMSYCGDLYMTRLQLSDCDIYALQAEYGRPTSDKYSYKAVCKTTRVNTRQP